MTDHDIEQQRAERIRRLQARRPAATPRATADGEGGDSSPRSAVAHRRRGHPAAATRWLLAGVSVASFFTIAGAVAVADQTAAGSPQTVTTTAPPVTANPVVPVTPAPVSAAPVAPAPTPRAPANPAPAPAPHTVTRGS
jgi:hypothetical protein